MIPGKVFRWQVHAFGHTTIADCGGDQSSLRPAVRLRVEYDQRRFQRAVLQEIAAAGLTAGDSGGFVQPAKTNSVRCPRRTWWRTRLLEVFMSINTPENRHS